MRIGISSRRGIFTRWASRSAPAATSTNATPLRVPHVVIVNETFARRHFPGVDPIGRTLVTGMAQLPSQVVGVVADVRGETLNTPPEADYFLPSLQRPETFTNVLVRTQGNPAAIAPLVRDALRSVDPDLPLLQPQALTTVIAQTVADRKLALVLLASFAALALLLASLGVYSVMAHLVTFRTSEIGIRMALGATPGAVMRMVLGHSSRLTLVGIVLGVAGGLAVSRLMQQVLFEVNPADPLHLSRRVDDALARRRMSRPGSRLAGRRESIR